MGGNSLSVLFCWGFPNNDSLLGTFCGLLILFYFSLILSNNRDQILGFFFNFLFFFGFIFFLLVNKLRFEAFGIDNNARLIFFFGLLIALPIKSLPLSNQ